MRWIPSALGLAGIAQHALMAMLEPDGYVSVDISYLVMWLAVIGAFAICYMSCGCYGWGGDGEGCDCCGEHCHCGDCARCSQDHDHGEHGHGHEGHSH